MAETGRPPMFETAEQMQEEIDEYIASCVPLYLKDDTGQIMQDKYGNPIVLDYNVPTITGLCLAIGFESRQSFYDYEKKPEFTYTIKRARLHIENIYEKKLIDPCIKPTGPIFALKNMGWVDKQETELTGGVKIVYADRDDERL
jgi:hypothetical protein